MLSIRVIAVVCYSVAACLSITARDASAQTCTINSTARGPLSCAVTTTVTMRVRIPTIVGVSVTPGVTSSGTGGKSQADGSVVEAGIGVKANRSYAIQIARAPIDSTSITLAPPSVTWSAGNISAELGDTPVRIDQSESAIVDRPAMRLALRGSQGPRGGAKPGPIGLMLTVIAP